MTRLPISGFSLAGRGPAYHTGGFQLRHIHSVLILHEEKLAVEGRFLWFRFYEEFRWSDIVAIRTRRSYPAGHCLELVFLGGDCLRVFSWTSRQARTIREAIATVWPDRWAGRCRSADGSSASCGEP